MERFDYRGLTPARVRAISDAGIEEAERLVTAVPRQTGKRTFENTLLPLSQAAHAMWTAAGRSDFLSMFHPDAAVREAASPGMERHQQWTRALPERDAIASAITEFAGTTEAAGLRDEEERVLQLWKRDLRRAGWDLAPKIRKQSAKLRARVTELEAAFERNVNEWADDLDLGPEDISGLSAAFVARLAAGDEPGTRRLGITTSEVTSFLEQSDRRDLRETVLKKSIQRADPANRAVLDEIVGVRREVARLHGYASWSDFANEARMSGSAKVVMGFLGDLIGPLRAQADREQAIMHTLPEAPPETEPIQAWDWWYLTECQRRAMGADATELEEYLSLDVVLAGLFDLVRDVFGVTIEEQPDPRGWHESVRLITLTDSTSREHLADVYLDLFSREGKRPVAFQLPLRWASIGPGDRREPAVLALMTNAAPARSTAPTLLSHYDIEMLFHEFGHVLEFGLSRARTLAVGETWGEVDFIEAPSQIMEHWTWDPTIVGRFARHHATGAPPPAGLLERIAVGRGLNAATRMLWIFGYRSLLDQAIHGPGPIDVETAYRQSIEDIGFPFPADTFQPSSFGHAVSYYDAGFYSYLWAQVYGDDIFSVFLDHGLTSLDVGARYRAEILEPSWSRPAADRLRRFLGREPSNRPFLQRIGIG